MFEDFSVVSPAGVEPESFDTVDISHRKYTEALGCSETRVNYFALEPGEEVHAPRTRAPGGGIRTAHRGSDRDRRRGLRRSQGGVVRVGPEPIRSVCNRTDDETHRWIMIGAPPVGTIDDFGEYVVPTDE